MEKDGFDLWNCHVSAHHLPIFQISKCYVALEIVEFLTKGYLIPWISNTVPCTSITECWWLFLPTAVESIWSNRDLSLSGNPLRSQTKVGKGFPPSVKHVNLTRSPDLCSLSKSPWIWGGDGGSRNEKKK